jgi:ADP-ribose pyrophosphatase YjhB (NUDIX family)
MELKNGYYRLSVKALILDETRTKFLLVQSENGKWELPGGGLDWGEKLAEGLRREIREEMGIEVTTINSQPAYVITAQRDSDDRWTANVIYEVQLAHFNFVPSDECVALQFVSKAEAEGLYLYAATKEFLTVFNSKNHQ